MEKIAVLSDANTNAFFFQVAFGFVDGEFFKMKNRSGQYGIGYFTWTSYTLVKYPEIIIGMLTIGGLGTLCTLLVRKACVPLLRWQQQGGRS